jgi:hypothetical protein
MREPGTVMGKAEEKIGSLCYRFAAASAASTAPSGDEVTVT